MRWIAIALGIVAVAAACAVAALLPDLRWPVSVACVVLSLGVAGWMAYRARARARLRESLVAPAQEPSSAEATARFRRGMQDAARPMHPRTGRRRAVYERPWYALLGSAGAGKSSFLHGSGLPFVRTEANGPTDRGGHLGEWRTCSEAVLFEASGGLVADAERLDDWRAAMDELRRARPALPLDGVLVCVSAADLLAAGDGAPSRLAVKLRELVAAAERELESILPVYLIVTKVDLLPGFAAFWGDLGAASRSQLWGASLEAPEEASAAAGDLAKVEFDLLARRAFAHWLERIATAGNARELGRAALFPLALHALRSPLARFVTTFCGAGAGGERALLRGFYLTSARQEGADVAIPGLAGGLGVPVPDGPGNPRAAGYFVADVLRAGILPDRGWAAPSPARRARDARSERRAAAAIVAMAIGVLVPGALSARHNVAFARQIDAAALQLKTPSAPSPGTRDDASEALFDGLENAEKESTGLEIPGWIGPRAARALLPAIERAHLRRLHAYFLSHLGPRLDAQLSAVANASHLEDSVGALEDRTPLRNAYDSVQLAAALIQPAGGDSFRVAEHLADAWSQTLDGARAVVRERLVAHAERYLRAVASTPDLRWPRSLAFQRARARIRDLRAAELPYHWVLRRAYGEAPIVARDLADASSLKYLACPADQVLVRGFYTVGGWQRIQAVLDAADPWPPEAHVERWVLGDPRVPEEEGALRQQVRARYFDDYATEWTALLDRCSVNQPQDATSARDELTALKGPTGFYHTLFALIGSSAISEPAPEPSLLSTLRTTAGAAIAADGGAPDAGVTASPVQRRLRPLLAFGGAAEDAPKPAPLDKYLTILETLRTALEPAGAANAPDPGMLFLNAKRGVENLLDGIEEPLRSSLLRLLVPPVSGTVAVVETGETDSASATWRRKVWNTWNSRLRGRYPFASAKGHEAAEFDEFRSFFQPDGPLWSFVQSNLSGWVELDDRTYVAKAGAPGLRGDLLSCLTVAQEITDAFFGGKGEPGLTFAMEADWSAADVTDAKLWIGEKATPLPRGQWSAAMRWNGQDVRLEWMQQGRPIQVLSRHSFPLFELFEEVGGLTSRGAGRGVYQVEVSPLGVEVRTVGREDAMRADFFRRLECPPELTTRAP